MLNPPTTKEGAEATTYGSREYPYRPNRCAYSIPVGGRSVNFCQCSRKPGHGPDNLYCKQHAKMVAEHLEWVEKRERRQRAWEERRQNESNTGTD